MNQSGIVKVGEATAQLAAEPEQLARRQRPVSLQVSGKGATTEVFEDHVLGGAVMRDLVVEERHDVVVNADPAEHFGFPLSPFRI